VSAARVAVVMTALLAASGCRGWRLRRNRALTRPSAIVTVDCTRGGSMGAPRRVLRTAGLVQEVDITVTSQNVRVVAVVNGTVAAGTSTDALLRPIADSSTSRAREHGLSATGDGDGVRACWLRGDGPRPLWVCVRLDARGRVLGAEWSEGVFVPSGGIDLANGGAFVAAAYFADGGVNVRRASDTNGFEPRPTLAPGSEHGGAPAMAALGTDWVVAYLGEPTQGSGVTLARMALERHEARAIAHVAWPTTPESVRLATGHGRIAVAWEAATTTDATSGTRVATSTGIAMTGAAMTVLSESGERLRDPVRITRPSALAGTVRVVSDDVGFAIAWIEPVDSRRVRAAWSRLTRDASASGIAWSPAFAVPDETARSAFAFAWDGAAYVLARPASDGHGVALHRFRCRDAR